MFNVLWLYVRENILTWREKKSPKSSERARLAAFEQPERPASYTTANFDNMLVTRDGSPPAGPDEICMAKMDKRCPRCNRPGEFDDGGYCFCGFAY